MWITDGPLGLLISLISQGGLIVFFAVILFRVDFFRSLLIRSEKTLREYIILTAFFSGMGIIGTYTGIPIQGALANARVVGVFVGGLVGGPVVGIISGLIAGFHRWAIDIGGFTSVACMLSTIVEGCIAALLYKRFQNSSRKWLVGMAGCASAEILQMIIILIVAKPYPAAVELVSIIGIPMIVGNSIGIGMFIAISESLFHEEDRIAARQSQKVLDIVETTLPFFRKGYNPEQAKNTAEVIYNELDFAAVAFTDLENILAHVGLADDHHLPGASLLTEATRTAIATGELRIAKQKSEIGCNQPGCPLKSAVIVPLKRNERPIGTLKIYKDEEFAINQADVELAKGLGSLLSLQIELSEIDTGERLLAKARLRALQSQINPHFLFNTMNTISSLISDDPDNAKNLLLNLSDYYRNRLKLAKDVISLKSEIENIEAYFAIEKARFGDKLSISYEISCDTDFLLPPLILQPIVENAVKHGIQKSLHNGSITITAKPQDTGILIGVADDGIGIDPSVLAGLLDSEESFHGLGNVNQRLINLYGPSNGLRIESEPHKGTTVWMYIPSEC